MEERNLSDIRLVGESYIEFKHSAEFGSCSHYIKDFNAIYYDDVFGILYFYPNSDNIRGKKYTATKEDFEELRSVILKSPQVVTCGDYIFSLNNVVTFSKAKREGSLYIDCRTDGYIIEANGNEEIKAFGIAMRKKWQKTLSEFDQSKKSVNIEEGTLIR